MSDVKSTVQDELFALATHLPPRDALSAVPPSRSAEIVRALHAIRDTICPQSDKIARAATTLGGQFAITIIDIALCAALRIDIPPVKVCELIVHVGIHRFCQSPAVILEEAERSDQGPSTPPT